MADFIDLEKAIEMPSLRLVLISSTPSPWGEAVKGFFRVKRIPYVPVRHPMGKDQSLLRRWTAQESAPVAVYNDERPRSTWPEQLYLAERLNPQPPLIPGNLEERVAMFGWCNELAGENGLGWARRTLIFHRTLGAAKGDEQGLASMRAMAGKYNYSTEAAQSASRRVAEIVKGLSDQIGEQKKLGRTFLIGNQLSALDIMWAAFAALIKPLPEELCPMAPGLRAGFTNDDPAIEAALSPLLMEHRDIIYRQYLELPLVLERG
jgi:glutathione S-transferase